MPPRISLEDLLKDTKENRRDGQIMVVPGVEFSVLRSFLLSHAFSAQQGYPRVENMIGICDELSAMLDNRTLNLSQRIDIQVAASMAYLIDTNEDTEIGVREKQKLLLVKAFCYSDSLNPLPLHMLTEALWDALYIPDRLETLQNVVRIAVMIAPASLTGKVVANCLMWSTLAQITGKSYQMHRIRMFDEWLENLIMCNFPNSKNLDEAQILYLVVAVMSFLVTTYICADNTPLEDCGFFASLIVKRSIIKRMIEWHKDLLVKPLFFKHVIPNDVANFAKNTVSMTILPGLTSTELVSEADD